MHLNGNLLSLLLINLPCHFAFMFASYQCTQSPASPLPHCEGWTAFAFQPEFSFLLFTLINVIVMRRGPHMHSTSFTYPVRHFRPLPEWRHTLSACFFIGYRTPALSSRWLVMGRAASQRERWHSTCRLVGGAFPPDPDGVAFGVTQSLTAFSVG